MDKKVLIFALILFFAGSVLGIGLTAFMVMDHDFNPRLISTTLVGDSIILKYEIDSFVWDGLRFLPGKKPVYISLDLIEYDSCRESGLQREECIAFLNVEGEKELANEIYGEFVGLQDRVKDPSPFRNEIVPEDFVLDVQRAEDLFNQFKLKSSEPEPNPDPGGGVE